MKLRIQGNSLRLRLKRGEVESFAAHGQVTDEVPLAVERGFTFGLLVADIAEVEVAFSGFALAVRVPRELAHEWANSERVGFEAEIGVDNETLKVQVEKDFRCLHRRTGEDESDNFPHPAEPDD